MPYLPSLVHEIVPQVHGAFKNQTFLLAGLAALLQNGGSFIVREHIGDLMTRKGACDGNVRGSEARSICCILLYIVVYCGPFVYSKGVSSIIPRHC